jgi:hypothetical protein
MFDGVTLSTANYNSLLIGWATQTVKNGVSFHGGNSKYSPGAAATARAVLIGTYGWTIIDGGESIVPVVDVDLTISNTTVAGSESTCFNALNEITIAGDGKNVVFESASNVTIIAGQSIRFLPGFHAKEGSYTHAYITTDASFCDALPMPLMAAEPVENKSLELKDLDPNDDKALQAQASLKVYPNPNKGQFTVRLENMESQVNVLIFNALGAIVHQQKTSNEILNIDLSNTQPGIYFVRAFNEKEQITQKLIVK